MRNASKRDVRNRKSLADELEQAKTKEQLQQDLERYQLKVYSKGKYARIWETFPSIQF